MNRATMTAADLQNLAMDDRDDALEEAARVCDREAREWGQSIEDGRGYDYKRGAETCAAYIRQLKSPRWAKRQM